MADMINSLEFNDGVYVFSLPFGTCSTAAATGTKKVEIPNFSLKTGARILVKFTVTNEAPSPTLQVGNTNAASIKYRGKTITTSSLEANRVYDFVYDGTNWELIGDINTDNNTDTKNTAGATNTSEKIFLIGATNQGASPQTYSHDTAYVGTDGCLYSNGTKVSVEGHGTHVSYGTTTQNLGASASPGTATSVSRSDHIHKLPALSDFGIQSSATEISYTKGVTENIQDQLLALDSKIDGKQPGGSYVSKTDTGVQGIAGGLVLGTTNPSGLSGTGKGRIMATGSTNPLFGVQAEHNGKLGQPFYFQSTFNGEEDILYIGPTSKDALMFKTTGDMYAPANFEVAKSFKAQEITEGDKLLTDKYSPKEHTHSITAAAADDKVVILEGSIGQNRVSYKATHANSGVTAGTYKSVTVDGKGHVTAGTNPTTLEGYGITDVYSKTAINSLFSDNEWYDKGNTILAEEADLNECLEIGKYYANTEAIAKTLKNCPTKTNFCMFVLVRTSGSSKTQLILDLNGYIFMRSCKSNGEWNSWKNFATTDNLSSLQTSIETSMKEYTDTEIGKLVDEAPELLNTLKEIAAVLNDNPDVIKNILIDLDKKVDKINGKGLSTEDYTTADKTKLSNIQSGAQVNQNAFSNVKVGTTSISADSPTDTVELAAGTGISLTLDTNSDKVTITNSGVWGVKGAAESSYQKGEVVITPGSIGLGKVDNIPDIEKDVSNPQKEYIAQAIEPFFVFYNDGKINKTHEEIVAAIEYGKEVRLVLNSSIFLPFLGFEADDSLVFYASVGSISIACRVNPDSTVDSIVEDILQNVQDQIDELSLSHATSISNINTVLDKKIEATTVSTVTLQDVTIKYSNGDTSYDFVKRYNTYTLQRETGESAKIFSGVQIKIGNNIVSNPASYLESELGTHSIRIKIPNVTNDVEITLTIYDYNECCFVPGTLVQTSLNGDSKPIETIEKGDIVVSYDIQNKEFYLAKVKSVIVKPDVTDVAEVYFDNGEKLVMNAYHPIYTDEGFHSITKHDNYEELKVGDLALTSEGWAIVTQINRYESQPQLMYNLDVIDLDETKDYEELDTFIANKIVVHNNTKCPELEED